MNATEKRLKAEKALETAKSAEIEGMNNSNAADEAARVKSDLEVKVSREDAVAKTNATFTGNVADSKRVKVTVEYKYENRKDRIKCGAVVMKNGVEKAEIFRIPVKTEVELPVEVIAQLKGRKIQKYNDTVLEFVSQLVITKV